MHGSRMELYGESIFTSFRTVKGVVLLRDEHLKRLYLGVNEYYLNGRMSFQNFVQHFSFNEKLNSLASKKPNHYFRLTVFADGKASLQPESFSLSDLSCDIMVKELPEKKKMVSLKSYASPYTDDFISIKAGSYFQNLIYKKKAIRNGFDDAIFFRNEQLTEASTSNIIFVAGNTMVTPHEKGMLLGLGLRLVKQFCEENGYEYIEKKIKKDQLNQFDFAFLTNSVTWLTPVKAIDSYQYDMEKAQKLNTQFENNLYNEIQ